jgi:hypothetical protein
MYKLSCVFRQGHTPAEHILKLHVCPFVWSHVTMCTPLNMLQCVHHWTCYNVHNTEHVTMCTPLNMLQCVQQWTCYNICTAEHVKMCAQLNMLQCAQHWTCYNVYSTEHTVMNFNIWKWCRNLSSYNNVAWNYTTLFPYVRACVRACTRARAHTHAHTHTHTITSCIFIREKYFQMKFQFIHLNKWSTMVPNITGTWFLKWLW